jgi:hypothetical protein
MKKAKMSRNLTEIQGLAESLQRGDAKADGIATGYGFEVCGQLAD